MSVNVDATRDALKAAILKSSAEITLFGSIAFTVEVGGDRAIGQWVQEASRVIGKVTGVGGGRLWYATGLEMTYPTSSLWRAKLTLVALPERDPLAIIPDSATFSLTVLLEYLAALKENPEAYDPSPLEDDDDD